MRPVSVIGLCALLLGGCASPKKAALPKAPPAPQIVPLTPILGKVVLVNTQLKYVVVDFSLSRPPAPGETFNVYRAGMKVGEVRINDLSALSNFAADISAGEATVGDEVRTE